MAMLLSPAGEYPHEDLRQHARISGACLDAALGVLPHLIIKGTQHPTKDGTCIRCVHLLSVLWRCPGNGWLASGSVDKSGWPLRGVGSSPDPGINARSTHSGWRRGQQVRAAGPWEESSPPLTPASMHAAPIVVGVGVSG